MKKRIKNLPKCFLITPIGSPDSSDRRRLKQWSELIYEPALKGKYKLIRPDLISSPGFITKQVIDNIIDADLAIVDFTPSYNHLNPNPNVMYEAAIRHIAHKPVIHIAPVNVTIPFDIKDFRTITYILEDLSYPKKIRDEIKKNISIINSPGYRTPEIIGHTFDLDRIVDTPEKFIQILKDKLFSNNQKRARFEDIINYGTTTTTTSSGTSLSTTSYRVHNIICPDCGGLAISNSNYESLLTIAGERRQYQCIDCGLIFFS